MSHYFINDKNVKSQKYNLCYEINNKTYDFLSDNGVFSKNEIDEGSSFLLQTYLKKGKIGRALDVGAGIGFLGIIISVNNDVEVDMIDINERAVQLCQNNIINNGAQKCRVYLSNIYEKINSKYDVIISNPPIRAGKKVVFEILEKANDFLNNDGELWIVIRKSHGSESAKNKLVDVYGNCDIIGRNKGFYVLRSKKYN